MKRIDEINNKIEYLLNNVPNYEFLHGSNEFCFENIAFSIGTFSQDDVIKRVNELSDYFCNLLIHPEGRMKSDFYRMITVN